jgi:hypothetical protein
MSLADFSSSLPSTSIPDANLLQPNYWTATTWRANPNSAILVGLRDAVPSFNFIAKSLTGYARAVRGGVPPSP